MTSSIVFFLVPLGVAILVGLLRSAALGTGRPRRPAPPAAAPLPAEPACPAGVRLADETR